MDRAIFIRLGLIVVTLLVYWQATRYGFVDFDDPEYVRDNANVLQGLTKESMKWAFTTGAVANWHPLTWLSLMLDVEIHGRNTGGFHLTNVVIHILNVLLLFEVLSQMTGAVGRSGFVAILLAVHPMHVESVAWISERKDVLSMLFGLLTIWAYTKYFNRDMFPCFGRFGWYALALVCFALGLMAKPMLVTLPCVLLLVDYWPLRRLGNPRISAALLILEKIPFLLLAAADCVITYMVQHGGGKLEYGVWTPLSARLANATVSYVRYLAKLFWPVDLAALYPNPSLLGKEFWSWWQVGGAAVVIVVVSAFIFTQTRKRRYLAVGWLWFLGTLVPVIGLVQVGPQAMADRYAYFPYIGLYIILVWGAADVASHLRYRFDVLRYVGAAVVALCIMLSIRQVGYWRDSHALFEHAVAVTRDNWLMHADLGVIFMREKKFEQAAKATQQAIATYPNSAWLHEQLGSIYSESNLYQAQLEYEKAIELDPNFAKAQLNLGVVLTKRDRTSEALAHLYKAAELEPDNPEAFRSLAVALGSVGRYSDALDAIQRAIQLRKTGEYLAVLNIIRSQMGHQTPSSSQPQDQ